ncbi:hypothetical protein [Undibacterium sp. Ji22W]|uniref:hypothetical protein n=1 Tax=Undibacterium sp. Ji22W TaxID=3413038 RepID=UPI003BF0D116
MRFHHLFAYLIFAVSTAHAQEPSVARAAKIQDAIDAVFPGKQFVIWNSIEGDFNGDGVNDFAAVVVSYTTEGAREERLLVMAGGSDGRFTPLSVSGEFCKVDKFYNLSASPAGKSFEVEGVGSADATHSGSFTFKFRYNTKLRDFELIGREDHSVDYDANSSYKVSVNYLTKEILLARQLGKNYIDRHTAADGSEKIIERTRRAAKLKEAKMRFDSSMLFRLQGFDCARFWDTDPAANPPLYIDENFKIQSQ